MATSAEGFDSTTWENARVCRADSRSDGIGIDVVLATDDIPADFLVRHEVSQGILDCCLFSVVALTPEVTWAQTV